MRACVWTIGWCFLGVLGSTVAAAGPKEADEEILVYEDPFARWDKTRWLVVSEVLLPIPAMISDGRIKVFRSASTQIRLVMACDKEDGIGNNRLNVDCVIEDMSILATASDRQRNAKDRALVQDVLDSLDDDLTGATLQLQVDAGGGVNNLGIGGWQAIGPTERAAQEHVRQLLLRTLAGFHQKIPDQAQRAGQSVEYNSKVMNIPSLIASRGSSTLVHTTGRYRNNPLVQTLGEGVVTVNLPNPGANDFDRMAKPPQGVEVGGTDSLLPAFEEAGGLRAPNGYQPSALPAPASDIIVPDLLESNAAKASGFPPAMLYMEASYNLSHSGVAVYDIDTGIMTERVWTTQGIPTARSALQLVSYRQVGQLTMLDQDEQPDVGQSHQVTLPGVAHDVLPSMKPLQSALD